MGSPGAGLYTRGFSLCYRFWHLFWLLDTLGIKNPLGGISAIVALLTKMAAEITAPAKSVKILKITIYWPSMACNTSKFLFWWVEFISNEKIIIWIDWGTKIGISKDGRPCSWCETLIGTLLVWFCEFNNMNHR